MEYFDIVSGDAKQYESTSGLGNNTHNIVLLIKAQGI